MSFRRDMLSFMCECENITISYHCSAYCKRRNTIFTNNYSETYHIHSSLRMKNVSSKSDTKVKVSVCHCCTGRGYPQVQYLYMILRNTYLFLNHYSPSSPTNIIINNLYRKGYCFRCEHNSPW